MISKNDCLLLLAELEAQGIDTKEKSVQLFRTKEIPLDVLKFINSNRQLDVTAFYEHLRQQYNKGKKSKLYGNIVKETVEPNVVLTTLASLNVQILLHSKYAADYEMFLKHSRAEEVAKTLAGYFHDFDINPCIQLLRIIRADIKSYESITK